MIGMVQLIFQYHSAGVPQVVLPVWMDTFDFARRVEFLGIGRWGNQQTGTSGGGGELGNALIDVLLGPNSQLYLQRAKELSKLCHQNGGGRNIAARIILKNVKDPASFGVPEKPVEEQAVVEEASEQAVNGSADETSVLLPNVK
jgi:hypothetical protein